MDSTFRISVDLADKLPNHPLTAEAFPNLATAVQIVTGLAWERWGQYAKGLPLPSGQVVHNRTGEYFRSILMRGTGPFSAEVYSELAYASVIEDGAPARDMKKILGSSLKVRLTKDGRRYLIIPFRHDTPGTAGGNNEMPQAVHNWWKQNAGPSSVSGTYARPTTHHRDAQGVTHGVHDLQTRLRVMVPGWRYDWGNRLGKGQLERMGLADHQVKRMAGMVNFRVKGMSGGAAHSQYLTFRTMVEGGKGWIAPAQPGKHVAKQVADDIRPIAEQMFQTAMTADVQSILSE